MNSYQKNIEAFEPVIIEVAFTSMNKILWANRPKYTVAYLQNDFWEWTKVQWVMAGNSWLYPQSVVSIIKDIKHSLWHRAVYITESKRLFIKGKLWGYIMNEAGEVLKMFPEKESPKLISEAINTKDKIAFLGLDFKDFRDFQMKRKRVEKLLKN